MPNRKETQTRKECRLPKKSKFSGLLENVNPPARRNPGFNAGTELFQPLRRDRPEHFLQFSTGKILAKGTIFQSL